MTPDPMFDDVECVARAAYLAATATPAPNPAPVSGWRDIATAPKDGSVFLVWNTAIDGCAFAHWAAGPEHWLLYNCGGRGGVFTHWQPLPAPPKQQEPK